MLHCIGSMFAVFVSGGPAQSCATATGGVVSEVAHAVGARCATAEAEDVGLGFRICRAAISAAAHHSASDVRDIGKPRCGHQTNQCVLPT